MRTKDDTGGDEWNGQWQKCKVGVESKSTLPVPFALEGSSGTMAVQTDTGNTSKAGDMSPDESF